jgi:REP element-mobilizing transposase RayT
LRWGKAGGILLRAVPIYHRVYAPGELQFLTGSTYRRVPVSLSDRFPRCFVERLEEVRRELNFLLVGWVLMPEHFHLLLRPEPAETPPLIMKELKEESAKRILRTLRANAQHPWCRKMLASFRIDIKPDFWCSPLQPIFRGQGKNYMHRDHNSVEHKFRFALPS